MGPMTGFPDSPTKETTPFFQKFLTALINISDIYKN